MQNIKEAIHNVKKAKPVILNLTNFVTMEFVANCQLSIGAAPIMCTYEDEMEELVDISSVVYINIGTLNDHFIKIIEKAIILSERYNKPIVMDPVGCGATKIRTKTAKMLAPHCKIIRGNASEIMALKEDRSSLTRGVESVLKTEEVTEIADKIAKDVDSTIVVSGAIDYITNGEKSKKIKFGSPVMTSVTGMGCSLSAVIAAVFAVEHNHFEAAVVGTEYFSLCGTLASQKQKTSGSFKTAFIDELYSQNYDSMSDLYN